MVQRLPAVYGLRPDMLADVLIPGVLDALGVTAEAERIRHNLGADVQQPLVQLVCTLA